MNPAVLVTGASSGIGAATARHFLEQGWEVALLARRADALGEVAAPWPGRSLILAADVTDPAAPARVQAEIANWRPRLAALIHCAGAFLAASMDQTSPEAFERLWRVTVWSRFALTRVLLPLLGDAAGAAPRAVIHVGSLVTHRDFPNETAYGSAMHAVMGLARAEDVELRGQGIRACVVSPGTVDTPLTRHAFGAAAVAGALAPDAIATDIAFLVNTVRQGGYIPELFHVPQNST